MGRYSMRDELLSVKKSIRYGGTEYVYGEHQRDYIREWGKEHNLKLIISSNLEKESTATPYFSVRRK